MTYAENWHRTLMTRSGLQQSDVSLTAPAENHLHMAVTGSVSPPRCTTSSSPTPAEAYLSTAFQLSDFQPIKTSRERVEVECDFDAVFFDDDLRVHSSGRGEVLPQRRQQ